VRCLAVGRRGRKREGPQHLQGHASVTVTYDLYGHLMPGSEAEAAERLDAYLERENTQGRLAQLGR